MWEERPVLGQTTRVPLTAAVTRYEFATRYCNDLRVLDVGCGTGIGSSLLARKAAAVFGFDRATVAVEYAASAYGGAGVAFAVSDGAFLPVEARSADVIVCLETIEHMESPRRFISEAARVLRADGRLIVSTPRKWRSTNRPRNPFHSYEWSTRAFKKLLTERFDNVTIFGQNREQSSLHWVLQRLDVAGLRHHVPDVPRRLFARILRTPSEEEIASRHFYFSEIGLWRATNIVAVCRGPRRDGA